MNFIIKRIECMTFVTLICYKMLKFYFYVLIGNVYI